MTLSLSTCVGRSTTDELIQVLSSLFKRTNVRQVRLPYYLDELEQDIKKCVSVYLKKIYDDTKNKKIPGKTISYLKNKIIPQDLSTKGVNVRDESNITPSEVFPNAAFQYYALSKGENEPKNKSFFLLASYKLKCHK